MLLIVRLTTISGESRQWPTDKHMFQLIIWPKAVNNEQLFVLGTRRPHQVNMQIDVLTQIYRRETAVNIRPRIMFVDCLIRGLVRNDTLQPYFKRGCPAHIY